MSNNTAKRALFMDAVHIFTSQAYRDQPHLNEQVRTAWAILASLSVNQGDYECKNGENRWSYDGYADGKYCFSHPKHPAKGHVLFIKIHPDTIRNVRAEYREFLKQSESDTLMVEDR